jgi:hypothetical protein
VVVALLVSWCADVRDERRWREKLIQVKHARPHSQPDYQSLSTTLATAQAVGALRRAKKQEAKVLHKCAVVSPEYTEILVVPVKKYFEVAALHNEILDFVNPALGNELLNDGMLHMTC